MIVRGCVTDHVKVVDASTAAWGSEAVAETTPQTSTFDTLGYRSALVVVTIGATGGTNAAGAFTLTQSDTQGGTFVTVAGSSSVGDGGNYTLVYDVADLKTRWLAVHCVKTADAGTPSIPFSVTAILYNGDLSPLSQSGVVFKRILNA
jgi:hypothetical protein